MSKVLENFRLEGDRTIWIVVFILCSISVLVVYSAAGWKFFFGHLVKLTMGLFCMYIIHKWKFKYFSRIGLLSFWLSLLLLVLVFIFGISVNGASRWLSLAGHQFQPSDVAKLSILIFMCRQISKQRKHLEYFKGVFIHIISPLIVVCLLIFPNNFSTSALVFFNGLVLMFISKIKVKYLFKVLFGAILLCLITYTSAKYTNVLNKTVPRSSTWVSRIDNYFFSKSDQNLKKDYQINQALLAVYNGGITGVGPGKSTQRNILPYSYSDFIFAIMIEEYGVIFGAGVPILLYLILLFRAIRISIRTESVFGSLLSFILIFSLVIQALINMLVSVDILPVTGQTLPLISMGGTSILFTCISIGIVISISRDSSDRNYETA